MYIAPLKVLKINQTREQFILWREARCHYLIMENYDYTYAAIAYCVCLPFILLYSNLYQQSLSWVDEFWPCLDSLACFMRALLGIGAVFFNYYRAIIAVSVRCSWLHRDEYYVTGVSYSMKVPSGRLHTPFNLSIPLLRHLPFMYIHVN
jgi:hypothetical protein